MRKRMAKEVGKKERAGRESERERGKFERVMGKCVGENAHP